MAVDPKDTVVIDLLNAGEGRRIETLIRRRVIPCHPGAGPGTSQNEVAGTQNWDHFFWTRALAHWISETLDAALNALESLRLSGRTVGVISHINQGAYLKE